MKIEKQVSVGNLLSVLTILVSIGVAWGALSARMAVVESRLEEQRAAVMPAMEQMKASVWNLTVEQAEMRRDVEWIKAQISEE